MSTVLFRLFFLVLLLGSFFFGTLSSFAQSPTQSAQSSAPKVCEFTKGDQTPKALPYKSQRLLNIFDEVSQKTGVPAALLAAVARVESTTGEYTISNYTDDDVALMEKPSAVLQNIDAKIPGTQKALCPRSPTGALGLMQIQPSKAILDTMKLTNESERGNFKADAHSKEAVNNGAKYINKDDDSLTIEDYCNPRTQVYIAAGFILKKMQGKGFGDGSAWNPAWNENQAAFNAAAESYYGCLKYPSCQTGPNSYGDDIWTSFKSCGSNLNASTVLSPTAIPSSGTGTAASNEVITRVGNPPVCSANASTKKTIVLNPGHAYGLTDPLAVGGTVNGVDIETPKNIAVAQSLEKKLTEKGYTVYLVHQGEGFDKTNRYNDYQQRIDKSNSYNPDLYVEIHFQTDNEGPFSIYSDRRVVSTDGKTTQPNPNIVTPNVDEWLTNSRKAATAITTALADAFNKKYNTNYPKTKELSDYGCVGRACGGHLYTIGPQGTLANPDEGDKSKILRENKAVSVYIETLGLGNTEQGNDIELMATAYAQGIDTYFGSTNSTPANCPTVSVGSNVHYCQGDPQWATRCSMANAGCGPTSMAMVLSSFGDVILPPDMDTIFNQRGWRACADAGSVMPSAIRTYLPERGYTVKELGVPLDLPAAKTLLDDGYLIIGSVSIHIFVVDGVNPAENTVHLRDPARCGEAGVYWASNRTPWTGATTGGYPWYYAYAVKKIASSINQQQPGVQ